MNETVSFELAKLLTQKGFNNQCSNFYTNPRCKSISGNAATLDSRHIYYAPNIAEVVMWLYEKHGIWISCERTLEIENYVFGYTVYYGEAPQNDGGVCADEEIGFDSPEESYEAAIDYTLKNLIENIKAM